MEDYYQFTMVAVGAMFAMLNPMTVLPQFISLTSNYDQKQKKEVAKRASLISFAILLIVATSGLYVFHLFSISIPAFKLAGGILLLLIGLDLINAKPHRSKKLTDAEKDEAEHKDDISVFPMAIPFIAGPGAIATTLMLTAKIENSIVKHAIIVGIAALLILIIYVSLRLANQITKAIGVIGLNVLNRLMGVILAAIACQFLLEGLNEGIHWKF